MSERHVTFDIIVQAVGAVVGLTRHEIMAEDGRQGDRATARFVAWWLGQKLTTLGPSALGRLSGHRDHSAVIHGCGRVEELRARRPAFREQTDALLGTLMALERAGMLRFAATIDPVATARRVLAAPEREAVRVSTYDIVAMSRLVVATFGESDEPTPSPLSKEIENAA
jgi:hypothetical protein